MLIDWFTVVAQAINFLILVWLMKRFLYKPILKAIDAREQLIAKELADAETRKAEAGKERDAFNRRNQEFDQARSSLMTKAQDEVKVERNRLLNEARKAADDMSAKRLDSLQIDARNLHADINRRTQDEVFAIARKTLSDLANTSLEERLADVFERKLRELDDEPRSGLCKAMKSATEPTLVRSAFELPPAQRKTVQTAINVMCSADIHLRFETAPEVIGGIELTCSGQKLSWSIAEYLAVLERVVGELLKKQVKPESASSQSVTTESEGRDAASTPSVTSASAAKAPSASQVDTPVQTPT